MEEEKSYIHGECGEELTAYLTSVKADNEPRRECVAVEFKNLKKDSNGDLILILPPHEAKALAKRLIEVADMAAEVNYNILVHNQPFP